MDATQTQDLKQQLKAKWDQRNALNMEMAAIEKQLGGQAMQDYELTRHDGSTVRLSEMFGEHSQMVLVHNMGFACKYCSLWADGFNGYFHHLESGEYGQRAKFLLVSNDRPDQQQAGAKLRGWQFDMLSCRDTSLSKDWGYAREDGDKVHYGPGMMILEKTGDGTIRCHQQTDICPGDSLMGLFHMFIRLPDSTGSAFE
ncbi:MAG: DUF899 family protein [Planctomycetales bacterium]|nr:DUF899 family protein [bacterium]UNM08808.1 MAG: DUF899 family protein [Planctomycetales bacterium]